MRLSLPSISKLIKEYQMRKLWSDIYTEAYSQGEKLGVCVNFADSAVAFLQGSKLDGQQIRYQDMVTIKEEE